MNAHRIQLLNFFITNIGKMARTVRFSLKRFAFHNKTKIFLIVLIIVIILLLPKQTNDSRSYIENIFKTQQDQPTYSKVELDSYYKLALGLNTSDGTTNNECENEWMIAAIPGIDIEDYVWEYLSLLAMGQVHGKNEGRKIKIFLSKRSIEQLQRIFERLHFTDLGTVPSRCYRLYEAILVENGNNISFNTNLEVKSLFLLDEGERRYKEIAESVVEKYRQYFRLKEHFKIMASSEILNFKAQLEVLTEVPIIGMYIRTLQLPSTYYDRAMEFLRKIHYGSIFLVMCPSFLMADCREKFSRSDTVVIKQNSMELELAILSMCNHSIIENDFGLLGAFISEKNGDTIVYDGVDTEMEWFSKYMTENFENWYSIA